MKHEDYSYTYPIAYEGEEVQWDLMAKNGIISQEEADSFKAADALPVTLVDVFIRDLSGVRRLKFMRWMSSVDRTLGDRPAIPSAGNRTLAQRIIDYGSNGGMDGSAKYPPEIKCENGCASGRMRLPSARPTAVRILATDSRWHWRAVNGGGMEKKGTS